MRGLFILFILIAFLFLAIVWLRNRATHNVLAKSNVRQRNLKSLLNQQDSGQDSENRKTILYGLIIGKLVSIHTVFYSTGLVTFLKNILFPFALILAIEIANYLYIHLPPVPLFLTLMPVIYFMWYKMLAKKRKSIFTIDFTEALSSINGAISSGRTFLQAMDDYSKNNNNQLANQFGVITRRLNFGDSPEVVFMDSWRIYPYREYYFFIVAILLNINSGGRLREVLNKLQRSLATSTAMEKKMLTMTSEMRMAAKITGLIPFAFLLLLKFISEENFNFIFEDKRGNLLLYYLLGSVGIGIVIIKFLMRKL
ncbi:hypothetical protein HGT71_14615 [Rosenbergiella epipactidis]|uniref:type II secretion system F family protein n=1 Tax=Rosenbergiella epipactidis TaxID=1544694 RepID=UPI001BD9841C|nr:type II secretion system F family protein [Rosenbergiella epipactidis]MBT0719477.1 hypothetical protein [Rosenbergiella epipactidis]